MSYKLLGMDARGRGDYARAIPLLNRALSMVPTDRQIRFELGQAQYSAGAFGDAVRTLSPLLRDTDVRSEPSFIGLYLDAIGRANGAPAVVIAARSLIHSESGATAALFLGTALEQTGDPNAADSAYAAGLRRSPTDSALTSRLRALRARQAR
jgi:Flp pilus assembly protein TadD